MTQMRDPIARSGAGHNNACPPHKWNYRKESDGVERLWCSICNKKPGYSGRE